MTPRGSASASGCVICATGEQHLGGGPAVHVPPSTRRSPQRAVPGSLAPSAAARRLAAGSWRGKTLVIEPSWALVHQDGALELKRDHSVVVSDGRIESIVAGRVRGRDLRLPAHGQLLLPGFISGHTHVAGGTITRGIIEGGRSFARPLELADQLDDERLDDLTALNLLELLRSGCTTQLDMALSLRQARSYVRVARRLGARGYPGGMIPGIHRLFPIWFRSSDQALLDSVPGTLAEIADNLAFAVSVDGAEDGRILPQITVHATDTHTPETMAALAEAAAKLGHGIHMHLSQSAGETDTVRRLWGKRPVEWIGDFGFYAGPLFGAHMNGIDLAADPPVLEANGATYAHCPSAGGAGGGTQPWPELLTAGVNTSIGIDTHSNDYVENLKLAVLYGQARRSLVDDGTRLKNPTVWDAVAAATVNAAAGLRRDDIGRIAVGAKADLTTIDVTGLLAGTGAVPPEPLSNLLYAHGLSVRHVLTDGRLQLVDGRLVIDDESAVLRRGGAAAQAVWDQLAAEGWFTPTPR